MYSYIHIYRLASLTERQNVYNKHEWCTQFLEGFFSFLFNF